DQPLIVPFFADSANGAGRHVCFLEITFHRNMNQKRAGILTVQKLVIATCTPDECHILHSVLGSPHHQLRNFIAGIRFVEPLFLLLVRDNVDDGSHRRILATTEGRPGWTALLDTHVCWLQGDGITARTALPLAGKSCLGRTLGRSASWLWWPSCREVG